MSRRIFLILCGLLFLLCSCTGKKQDHVEPIATPYNEPHRPQFHFTPDSMWMNDPNGMVYYEGEYHLFYQHYPDSTVWGPMHWGHAVSKDLVHWEHLPVALYPDSLGFIFSGSAVVDWNNTSGLGENGRPLLIAIFTHHDPEGEKSGAIDFQYQSIAYSKDRGRTWTKYEGNPVLPNPGIRDFRDPKVFWHQETEKWVMIFAADDRVRLYHSPDLKDWTFASEFGAGVGGHGGVWECPDLFELPVDGNPADTRWVMLVSINPGGPNGGSATQYFLGDFDGETFTLDPEFAAGLASRTAYWADYGKDNYAGVTWSDIPQEDGRRLFIGWMSNWQYAKVVPTDRWRSAMTVTRTLSLTETTAGIRLHTRPVRELENIHGPTHETEQEISMEETFNLSEALGCQGATFRLELDLQATGTPPRSLGIELSNALGERLRIGYEPGTNRYYVDRRAAGKTDFSPDFVQEVHYAPRKTDGNGLRCTLLVDRSSVELFTDDGLTVMTELFFPTEDFGNLLLYAEGGEGRLLKARLTELESIW